MNVSDVAGAELSCGGCRRNKIMASSSGPVTECGCVIRESNGVTVCCVRSRLDYIKCCLWAWKLKAKQKFTTANDRHVLTATFKEVTRT